MRDDFIDRVVYGPQPGDGLNRLVEAAREMRAEWSASTSLPKNEYENVGGAISGEITNDVELA